MKNIHRSISLIALGATAFLLGTAPLHAAETRVIKFNILDSGHISVPVNINGRGPYKVGFDTGSPITFISTKLGKELGLSQGGGQNPMMGAMGMNFGGQSRATLGIGGATANNVPLMVLDHPTVETLNNLMGGFEGLIGFTYYSRFRMTIDYQKKEMTLKPVDFEAPDIMSTMMTMLMGGGNKVATVPPRAVVLGLKLEDLGEQTKETRVVSVVAGSAAESAGLRVGDRITGVNERWIFAPQDLYEATAALAPGIPAKVKVERGGKEIELTLKTHLGL